MKVHFGQVYTEAGSGYPFSTKFQGHLRELVTPRVELSKAFEEKYGKDWDIVIRIDAKKGLVEPTITGPYKFVVRKHVEYVICLPRNEESMSRDTNFRPVLSVLIDGVAQILTILGLDDSRLRRDANEIVSQLLFGPLLAPDFR